MRPVRPTGTRLQRLWPLPYPLTLAAYPVLALYLHNSTEISAQALLRPMLLSQLAASLGLLLFWSLYRGLNKAALAVSLCLVVFFSYGHLYDGLKDSGLVEAAWVRHRTLAPLVVSGLVIGLAAVGRAKDVDGWSRAAALFSFAALGAALVTTGPAWLGRLGGSEGTDAGEDCLIEPAVGKPLPDIYLIVMDAYERQDVLMALHGYDNAPFIRALESRGFYVPPAAMSNYRFTVLSLASMLNMDYIQAFPDRYDPSKQDRWKVARMINDNRVRRELECAGYSTVTLDSGVYWSNWEGADYFLGLEEDPYAAALLPTHISRFEALLLETSLPRLALDYWRQAGAGRLPAGLDSDQVHKRRVLHQLDRLPGLAGYPSPKVVYVHVVSPHPPFVFSDNDDVGALVRFEEDFTSVGDDRDSLDRYADTVDYLNGRLLEIIDEILSASDPDPVILITADHGWAESTPEDKMSIFQAYYLPSGDESGLYPTISAVNSFRVLFDTLFETDLGRLPDVGYHSRLGDIWNFERVENSKAQ